MEYLIGAVLAAAVAFFARLVGLDRERSFYTVVLIIVASYYILFATMAPDHQALIAELVAGSAFLIVAVIGFKHDLRYVAVAIIGHGVFDFFHHRIIDNPGVPAWWPGFCLVFDIVFGAWVLLSGRMPVHPE